MNNDLLYQQHVVPPEAPSEPSTQGSLPPEVDLPPATSDPAVSNDRLARLSHRHDLIITWLIENPDRRLGDCAAFFGVSQPWLSTIIHSSAFQERLRQRQETLFSQACASLREKLEGVAHTAIDRLGDAVENSDDPEFILDAADRALHRLGYAPRPSAGAASQTINQTQINVIDQETLREARALMDRARAVRTLPAAYTPAPLAVDTVKETP